jgi:hypothetical protein
MKRDMELIRKLILLIEDQPTAWAPSDIKIDGYTADQIGYHSYLLINSGLATGHDLTCAHNTGPYYSVSHLTSAGHDFADNARNQYVWDEVMDDIKKQGLTSVTIDLVKRLLDKLIRKRLDVE